MTYFHRILKITLVLLLTCVPSVFAFGNAEEADHSHTPELGSDLAVTLKVPLLDPAFSTTPVARLGTQPLLLQELTPELQPVKKILFWDVRADAEELSEQFNNTLKTRLSAYPGEKTDIVVYTAGQVDENQRLQLDAPLFADSFKEVPVASIGGSPITIKEFADDLQSVHSNVSMEGPTASGNDQISQLMERLITVRLIELEARNIGFDQTPAFKRQLAAFAEKTLLYGLLNTHSATVVLDEKAVADLYEKISLEAKLESYRFEDETQVKDLMAAYENGENFEKLIGEALQESHAVASEEADYINLNNLLPNIAKAASTMEIGSVSEIFRQADGFIIFKLVDRRFVESEKALNFARSNVLETQRSRAGTEYINDLIDRYATFDPEAEKLLDFTAIKDANPDILLSEALQPLLKDSRPLATVSGVASGQITVAQVAQKIKDTYFHGTDVPLKADEINATKEDVVIDLLFRIAGTAEAKKLELDKRSDYLQELAEFERRTLFDIFMQKVISPEIKLKEEDVRANYDNNLDEYMTPAMVRFKSLPFYEASKAEAAAEKLRKGSDFKWVSANAEGLVDVQDKDLLQFDRNILSLTSLPEELQEQAANARRGETLVYSEPNNFHYVLYFEDVFPPEPKPYEQVRDKILKIVYQDTIKRTLKDWVEKLKEAYETDIYLVTK